MNSLKVVVEPANGEEYGEEPYETDDANLEHDEAEDGVEEDDEFEYAASAAQQDDANQPNDDDEYADEDDNMSNSIKAISRGNSSSKKSNDDITNNLVCKICNKLFDNLHRLQRHLLCHDMSPELRKFKCDFCNKAFKFKHHLKVSSLSFYLLSILLLFSSLFFSPSITGIKQKYFNQSFDALLTPPSSLIYF